MADENTGTQPDPVAEIDIEAVDDLSPEDSGKLLRGEIDPPKKGTTTKEPAVAKDEFEVDPKSETVPHAVFHRANERRKAEAAEAVKERTRAEQAEARANTAFQRMAELLEAGKPAPAQEEPKPDPEVYTGDPTDYIGKIEWLEQREIARTAARKEAEQRQGQQNEQQEHFSHLARATANDVQQFTAQTPDYFEARNFYWNQRRPELMAAGYSQEQAIQIIEQDEISIAQGALQRRQSPAETLYKIAKVRGYVPSSDAVEAQTNGATPQRDANGKFVAAAAAMDKREATKAAAKSLGGSGGPGDVGEITPQMVADMSNEEFAAFKKKYGDNAMKKVFGVMQ